MENNILMFIILILVQLVSVGLILAILTSVFVKSRKKGFLSFTIYLLLSIYSLTTVFSYSILLGSIMLVIYIALSAVTYFVIRKKLSNGTNI